MEGVAANCTADRMPLVSFDTGLYRMDTITGDALGMWHDVQHAMLASRSRRFCQVLLEETRGEILRWASIDNVAIGSA
jgi:hypothetical protein